MSLSEEEKYLKNEKSFRHLKIRLKITTVLID